MQGQYLLELDAYDPYNGIALGDTNAATFGRSTAAYKQDGSQMASGTPRFETGKFGQALVVEEATTNLLSANQADVETDTTGFSGGGDWLNNPATISRDTSKFWRGSASLKTVTDGTVGRQGFHTTGISAAAATMHTFSAYVWAPAGASMILYIHDATNNVGNNVVFTGTGNWSRVSIQMTTGAASVTNLSMSVQTNNAQAISFWVDGLQIEALDHASSWTIGARAVETVSIPTNVISFSPMGGCIDFWVNFSSWNFASQQYLLNEAGFNSFALYITGGNLIAKIKSGSNYIYSSPNYSVAALTGWNHIALSWDGNVTSIYVNGRLANGVTASPASLGNSISFLGTGYKYALLDSVRISSKMRTAAELLAAATAQSAPVYDQFTSALYLVDASTYPSVPSASVRTLRFSQSGYTDSNGNFYEPRLLQPGHLRRDLFDQGTTFGASRVSYGETTLSNLDGALDILTRYGIDGRKMVIKATGYDKANPASTITALTCTIEQPVGNLKNITLRCRDRQAEFDKPFAFNRYAGTNSNGSGLEGDSSLTGKAKPVLYGRCFLATPVLVNSGKLIYQYSDGKTDTVPYGIAAADSGVDLTVGDDYVSQADMENDNPATWQNCTVRAWPAGGCIRLKTSPAGKLTVTAEYADSGPYTGNYAPHKIIKRILIDKLGYTSSDFVQADFDALTAQFNNLSGIFLNNDSATYRQIFDELASSIGCGYTFDNLNRFRIYLLADPSTLPSVATFTKDDISVFEKVPTGDQGRGVPAWKVNVYSGKNYSPLQENDYAGSITPWLREYYSREYFNLNSPTNNATQVKHLSSPELTFRTLLLNGSSEATRRLNLYSIERDMLNVQVEVTPSTLAILDIGNVITLQYPRYGYDGGRKVLIIGMEPDYAAGWIKLTVWG